MSSTTASRPSRLGGQMTELHPHRPINACLKRRSSLLAQSTANKLLDLSQDWWRGSPSLLPTSHHGSGTVQECRPSNKNSVEGTCWPEAWLDFPTGCSGMTNGHKRRKHLQITWTSSCIFGNALSRLPKLFQIHAASYNSFQAICRSKKKTYLQNVSGQFQP
jgi:hypothetical protein